MLGPRHAFARKQHLQSVFQARHVHHGAVLPVTTWKRGNEEGEGVWAVENFAAVQTAAAEQTLSGEKLVDGGLRGCQGNGKKYDGGFVALGLEDGFEGGHEMVEELVRVALHVGVDHHGSKQSVWKIRQIFREGHFGKNLLEHVKHR